MVQRLLALVAVLLILSVLGIAMLGYLAYDIGTLTDPTISVPGLERPARILFDERGGAHVEAASELDAYRALGYLHGRKRSWSVALLRQTAAGQLGEWYGPSVLQIDRFTRRIGIAAKARDAYHAMPPADQELLLAYTTGMNAALLDPEIRRGDEFVLFQVTPDPWEPWHTLAVERLLSWLAVPALRADSTTIGSQELAALREADARLRSWLHLHSFDESLVWLSTRTGATRLYYRFVTGRSALPLFEAVTLRFEGRYVMGLTVPGWPVFYAGQTPERAWAILPTARPPVLALAERPAGALRYERIRAEPDGNESLLRLYDQNDLLSWPRQPDAPSDTLLAYALRWPGFETASDWEAWRSLLTAAPNPAAFRLIEGAGGLLGRNGGTAALPSPAGARELPDGMLVTRSAWRPALETLLSTRTAPDSLDPDVPDPVRDVYSIWAAGVNQALLRAVDTTLVDAPGPEAAEVLTLLRNWNARYDPPSLGASVFETWLSVLALDPDSLHHPRYWTRPDLPERAVAALSETARRLIRRHGPDASAWRWENVQPRLRLYPVFSDSSLQADLSLPLAETKYAPVLASGAGHPSMLPWRSSLFADAVPATTAWSGWMQTDAWDAFAMQQRQQPVDGFLGRYLETEFDDAPSRMRPADFSRTRTIELRPPS